LKIGEVGEIICKTPLKFKGYYRSDNLTKKSLVNGYFKTGDLGKMDKNNYLYFVSRKQDVIISSGKNIYPIDIERELLKLSYLKESAIIGIKDKFFGEIVFAVCVLKKKINNAEEKIRKYLSKRIGGFQQPLGYVFIKQLPRNNLGKIQKNKLREIYNKKKIDLTRNLRRILN
jgi:acyl-CoA synthetase (AMP-forming)/AMP-acid ligase II